MQLALLAVTAAVASLLTYGAGIAWTEARRAPIAVEDDKGLHIVRDAASAEDACSDFSARHQLWP